MKFCVTFLQSLPHCALLGDNFQLDLPTHNYALGLLRSSIAKRIFSRLHGRKHEMFLLPATFKKMRSISWDRAFAQYFRIIKFDFQRVLFVITWFIPKLHLSRDFILSWWGIFSRAREVGRGGGASLNFSSISQKCIKSNCNIFLLLFW